MKNREQKTKELLAHNLIPTVQVFLNGSFRHYAELIGIEDGAIKNHLEEDEKNGFNDYFKALDYAIDKGILLKEEQLKI